MRRICSRWLLRFGGVANCIVALLHAVILFLGAPGYRYFGVPDLAALHEKGSAIPTVLTFGLTILFALFATYAFSGAGVLRRLPLLRTTLLIIGSMYALRGLALVQDVMRFMAGELNCPRALAFSGAALLIGVAYLAGTVPLLGKHWERDEA